MHETCLDDAAFCLYRKHRGIASYVNGTESDTVGAVTPSLRTITKWGFPVGIVNDTRNDMSKWKNGINAVALSMNENGFNNQTHWNMRCKFLEVGLRMRGLETIRENPDQIYENAKGRFFIYIPIQRRTKKENSCEEANNSGPLERVRGNLKDEDDWYKESELTAAKVNIKDDVISRVDATNDTEYIEKKCEKLPEEHQSKCEKSRYRGADDEVVLEDFSDKDLVPEMLLLSPPRLTCREKTVNNKSLCASSNAERKVCERESQPEGERSEADVRVPLSRLERLRRRVHKFFSNLWRNRVTPIDI